MRILQDLQLYARANIASFHFFETDGEFLHIVMYSVQVKYVISLLC